MPNQPDTTRATRRTFLGAAAMTATSYQRVLGANERIGVGFVGYGLIGKQHVGGEEAQAMCSRTYREPWNKELRSIVTV